MSEWAASRLKYLARANRHVLPESTDPQFRFRYVDIGDVTQGSISREGESFDFSEAPSRARRVAQPGDVVISTVRTYLRAVAGALETTEPTVYSTGFAVVEPRVSQVFSGFLAYLMQGDEFIQSVEARSVGVSYPAITAAEVMNSRCIVPPLAEQCAIADYLDRETAKIDTLIAKQNEMIATLRERRVGLVVATVTRGQAADVSTQPGPSWAGRVPGPWSVLPLKRVIAGIQTGTWGTDADGGENDITCVRVADFDRPRLAVGKSETLRSVVASDRRRLGLRNGDLLIEKSGGTAINPVGFVAIYDRDDAAVCANFIGRIRFRSGQAPRFWLYALHGSYASGLTWRHVKQTTGIQNLDLDSFVAERFPVPPLDKQREIADYLDRETAKIDTLIAKVERHIELAKERRSALITAAVTGQIDVTKDAA